jgi:hypothetical protein
MSARVLMVALLPLYGGYILFVRRSSDAAFARNRAWAFSCLRGLRLLMLLRFMPGVESRNGYRELAPQAALVFYLAFDPLFSFMQSVFHLLPFKLHVGFCAARLLADVGLVAPPLGCAIGRTPELWRALQGGCQRACALLGAAPASCACGDSSWAWFLPLTALMLGSGVLPVMLAYWLELLCKLRFLRGRHPASNKLLPDSWLLGFMLLHQAHAGLLLSLGLASGLVRFAPWMRPGACRAWGL